MKSPKPGPDAETRKDDATPKPAADRSSADATGGSPAAEEDIGTEGAGTEPRDSTERQTRPSPSKARRDGNGT